MSQDIQFLRAAARQPVPWKNGGGVTREVARDPGSNDTQGFDWRVSIAEVALAGPFSLFRGCQRHIAIIAGDGMGFVTAAGERMLKPREVHAFSGEEDVSATLPFGPVSDLNLIYRAANVQGSMRFGSGAGRWVSSPGHRVILLNVGSSALAGSAGGRPMELQPLDGVLAMAGAEISVASPEFHAVIEIRE
jgi:environmental stress-induced protein Ves